MVIAIGVSLLCFATASCAAYKATAPQGVSLSGNWQVNPARSDDAEAMLQEHLAELRAERERYMRRETPTNSLGIPPPGMPSLPPEEEAAPPPSHDQPQKRRPRRNDNLRRMLNISDTLVIAESGPTIDIESQLDTRRFEAGSHSQISLPTGELADSYVGWDGEWFVIERKARKGPRVTEKYRYLRKTDQLESQISWGGNSLLAGIKVHRIYDRMASPPPKRDPELGPVR